MINKSKCDVWNKQMCGTSKCVDAIRALWALRKIPGTYHGIECQLNIIEGVQYKKKKINNKS